MYWDRLKIKNLSFLVLFMGILSVYGQDSLVYRHQLGVGLPKLVNHVFSIDENAFLLNYRYQVSEKVNLRFGVDFKVATNESDLNFVAGKFGVDKQIKRFNKWVFYLGSDITCRYLRDPLINSDAIKVTNQVLLGIMYYFDEHFSMSMEPYLAFEYNYYNDRDSFDLDQQNQHWFSSYIGGVGFLQLNFHF